MKKILIVDNCNDTCQAISLLLKKNNFAVYCADCGLSAMEWLKGHCPDLVLCDWNLKDVTGTQLVNKIIIMHPQAVAIAMANERSVKDVVAVFKSGARDFVVKSIFPGEILQTIQKVFAEAPEKNIVTRPAPRKMEIRATPVKIYNNGYLPTSNPEYAGIIKQIALVAPTNFSVIIYGESGSGKEAIALQIHEGSRRTGKPFVAIDCGALSKELAGSELFGHEKGAFTGALCQKTGSLEAAHGGTIFLDEIGNLPYEIQVSLLRVVQERKIRRVGGGIDIGIDVRIIVASNINLWDAAQAGKFRADLYHRFNEFSIAVPPLRERKQDILLLADHFLQQSNAELGKNIKGFSKEVQYLLSNYIWYGNIRELKNAVKRATLLTDGAIIEVKSLPFELTSFFNPQIISPCRAKPGSQGANLNYNTDITYTLKPKRINTIPEYEVITGILNQRNEEMAPKMKNRTMFDICIPAN